MKARTTDAVCSGRRATWRCPLSTKSNISLRTTSVDSPMRWNTPRSSKVGVMISPYPAPAATRAKVVRTTSHGPD